VGAIIHRMNLGKWTSRLLQPCDALFAFAHAVTNQVFGLHSHLGTALKRIMICSYPEIGLATAY